MILHQDPPATEKKTKTKQNTLLKLLFKPFITYIYISLKSMKVFCLKSCSSYTATIVIKNTAKQKFNRYKTVNLQSNPDFYDRKAECNLKSEVYINVSATVLYTIIIH